MRVQTGATVAVTDDVEGRWIVPDYAWLFRSEFTSVVRTTYLIVHDRGRAEEIAQEAFLTLFQNWAKVSTYDKPGAWVRRIAIRMAVRQSRRERIRPGLELRAVGPQLSPLPDTTVLDVVGTLPAMQRAVLVLHYWEDLSVADIASLLQISDSTVKQHLFRARRKLAGLLGEETTDVP
jgi:DNA-directed RNA polymerase specialized sigma24 family protein